MEGNYSTQLQAGLGLIEETKTLLTIYNPGMTSSELYTQALESGLFPLVSARRLRNIIAECFTPRYLKTNSANYLKDITQKLPTHTTTQFFLVFTALANRILFDFITDVYWNRYSSGSDLLSTDEARTFVSNAVYDGKTSTIWSESTVKRMSSYLIGCCADYGLISSKRGSNREMKGLRLHELTMLFFAYWLHFKDIGDNRIISHDIWKIFGLEPNDVKEELKRISKKGWMIVQSAGDVTRISWTFNNLEEVVDVITES